MRCGCGRIRMSFSSTTMYKDASLGSGVSMRGAAFSTHNCQKRLNYRAEIGC